jgi:hypothetical protein
LRVGEDEVPGLARPKRIDGLPDVQVNEIWPVGLGRNSGDFWVELDRYDANIRTAGESSNDPCHSDTPAGAQPVPSVIGSLLGRARAEMLEWLGLSSQV